jgi:UPF0716 protein FxsA
MRRLLVRTVYSRLPAGMRGPVRVRSARVGQMDGTTADGAVWRPGTPRVIEGEVAPGPSV